MVVFPNAKINIGLNILRKRDDGFHDIETVFYPVPLKDALEIVENESSGGDVFEQTGVKVDSPAGNNLCEKAVKLIRENYEIPKVKMHLHKAIPFGAGLGGGSSDASFTLNLINELFKIGLNKEQLKNLASQIGSDCAFFIENTPMIAEGRGEVLKKIDFSLQGYFLVLVHPAIHVSTPQAYSMIKPTVPEFPLQKLIKQPLENWKYSIRNDFEEPIFKLHPKLNEIKTSLYNEGAVFAAMTGSGSALYGIFNKEVDLASNFKDCFVYQDWLA